MNKWLSAHGIGKRVPTVSGGTVLLGSSRGGENEEEKSVKRRVYDGVRTVSGGTVLLESSRGGENK
jgi:hypothetical protein